MPAGLAPLVSFVVPCYNYGRYLDDCLKSIFAQREADIEIIAIDDASTDHTPEVLRAFSDPRLRVITHARNQGHVVTFQEGLEDARGRFVAHIDPDDRYRPVFLERTLQKFREHPEAGMVYGDVAIIGPDGRVTAESCDAVHGGKDFLGNELVALLETNFICAPTVLARREAWARALPIPSNLSFSDWYFTLHMARESDFYYIHETLAEYRVHGSNHHARIILDRTEEPSTFRLLDGIFGTPEKDATLEAAKQRAKGRIYGAQYLALARKYFGAQMNADARRCFLRAIRYRPAYLARPDVLRHLGASLAGRRLYDGVKSVLKG